MKTNYMKKEAFMILIVLTIFSYLGCGHNNNEISNSSTDTTIAPVDTAGAVNGDWLLIREIADAQGLNPVTSTDASGSEIDGYIFETLNNVDPISFELIPYLASLPDVSSDFLSYTYQLKKNVTFSDGTPMTGNDVIFSMKVVKNPYVDDASLRNYY